jgi:long-chain fatty acid transport protein
MKKFITSAFMLCAVMASWAEGYQVNTFSAKQLGMGHAGVAMQLGSESQIFNPGALGFSDKTFQLSGSFVAIDPHAYASYNGTKYYSDNKISTPFNVATSFKIYDNLQAGVALYTPGGSAINWGENWPGAVLNQSVDIKLFTVQPTVSWRVLPNLSVGAGLMVTWGSVNLNKGLVNASSLDALLGAMGSPVQFGNVTPASVNLNGSSNVRVGYNIGALYEINRHWSVGASFRSQTRLTVEKGLASVSYANDAARQTLGQTLDNLNSTNFSASLPNPYVISLGVAYKPLRNLIIDVDLQYNGWKAYDQLDIAFDNLESFDQHLTKNYKNTFTYHVGAQYGLTKRFDVRAGMMVDTNPCDKNHYNPETPGQVRLEPSVGCSFRPIESLSIDFGFMYVQGLGSNGVTGEYSDFIAQSYPQLGLPATGQFTADYKVHAFIPALGFSYSF